MTGVADTHRLAPTRPGARKAFREAWRTFTIKAVVAAEYAIAEQRAREQMEAEREAAP